jgi:hypothetical protein
MIVFADRPTKTAPDAADYRSCNAARDTSKNNTHQQDIHGQNAALAHAVAID